MSTQAHGGSRAHPTILTLLFALDATAAAPPRWTALWTGQGATCVQDASGATWCAGATTYGRFGAVAGSETCTEDHCWTALHPVAELRGAAQVAISPFNVCWVGPDATGWCLGADHYGALGDGPGSTGRCSLPGTRTDCSLNLESGEVQCSDTPTWGPPTVLACSTVPVRFPQDGVQQMATLSSAACARTAQGWWCSGMLPGGQASSAPISVKGGLSLGDGTDGRWCRLNDGGTVTCGGWPTPTIQGVAELAVGDHVACLRDQGGAVSCWGSDVEGDLGRGAPPPPDWKLDYDGWKAYYDVHAAGPVTGLPVVTRVDAGSGGACALDERGGVWCWGRNVYGQVGAGDTAWRSSPTQVQGLPPISRLEVGPDHVCALDQEGALWCWGSAREGQLGVKAPETCRSDLIADQGRKVPCATRPLRVPPPTGG